MAFSRSIIKPAQQSNPRNTTSSSTAKKGYAGYGDPTAPSPGSPGGAPGYEGVGFRDTKSGMAKALRGSGTSFSGGPQMDPRYLAKTSAEVQKYRGGIAPTAKNMGSLAVQSRADAVTARAENDGRGLSLEDKRDSKVLTARAADKTKKLATRSRVQKSFAKKYFAARSAWAKNKGRSDPSGGVSGGRATTSFTEPGMSRRTGQGSKYGLF